jgi:hypothetical protein
MVWMSDFTTDDSFSLFYRGCCSSYKPSNATALARFVATRLTVNALTRSPSTGSKAQAAFRGDTPKTKQTGIIIHTLSLGKGMS